MSKIKLDRKLMIIIPIVIIITTKKKTPQVLFQKSLTIKIILA